MKIKNLAILGVAAAALSALNSCTQDPYIIPAKEEYTRAFIKQFGLIDPAQDWNMAQEGTVTVNVAHANSVKAYAKVGEQFYLVADLVDIEGSVTIPVDIPETTKEMMVKIDGRKYYTTPGGTVSADSRTIPDGASDYVSVNYNSYIEFDMNIINAITNETYGVLPEGGNNYDKEGIIKNFTMKYDGKPLTFYPVYFYTSSNHILGVSWIVDETEATEIVDDVTTIKEGYEKILIRDEIIRDDNYNEIEHIKEYRYVRKLPVYKDKIGPELQYADADPHAGEGEGGNNDGNTGSTTTYEYPTNAKNEYNILTGTNTSVNTVEYTNYGSDTYTWNDSSVPSFVTDNESYKAMIQSLVAALKDDVATNGQANFSASTSNGISYFPGAYDICKPIINQYLQENGYTSQGWELNDEVSYLTGIGFNNWGSGDFIYYTKFVLQFRKPDNSSPSDPGTDPTPASSVWKNYITTEDEDWCSNDAGKDYMRAAPITIDLSSYLQQDQRYFFYIDVYNSNGKVSFSEDKYAHTVYSYAPLNYNSSENKTPHSRYYNGTAFAAYYSANYEDGGRTFFSFEDWSLGHHDLNDLIFMVKTMKDPGDDDEDPPYTPPVIDEDNPDPRDPYDEYVDIPLSWLIAAEDLGTTDDFDFNDVVFSVTSITTNKVTYTPNEEDEGYTAGVPTFFKKVVMVKALAAGGTLPVYLHFNEYILGPNKYSTSHESGMEWHNWFGTSSLDMINTGRSGHKEGAVLDITAIVPEGFTVTAYSSHKKDGLKGFYITVGEETENGMNDVTIAADDQTVDLDVPRAPQMFLIPDVNWKWPLERYHILEAYLSFKTWVNNASSTDWYETPTPGTVYNRPQN